MLAAVIQGAIPNSLSARMSADDCAVMIFNIRTALKAVLDRSKGTTTRTYQASYDKLNDMVNCAIHLSREEHYQKMDDQIISLTWQQRQRRFLQDGYLPSTQENRCCIVSNHESVDEPNYNKEVGKELLKAETEYQAEKAKAKKEGKSTKVTKKKVKEPYRQCHCSQFTCTSPTSDFGSSCPILCLDPSTNA